MHQSLSRNKGVLLILLWELLFHLMSPSVVQNINSRVYNLPSIIIQILLFLLLPIITLYADMKVGGFCCTVSSTLLSFFITGVSILCNILAYNAGTLITNTVGGVYALIRYSMSVSLLLYGADQIPDASSEQLSYFIWWYTWCEYAGLLAVAVITCIFDKLASKVHTLLYVTVLHLLTLLAILLTCLLFRKWIKTDRYVQKKANPLKLVFNVLRYGRKNVYLYKRSALTYWENSSLSRIDLGKKMYGGPFEEHEVESVKTFFRLLPLLFCINLLFYSTNPLGRSDQWKFRNSFECMVKKTFFIEYVVILLCILIKQFVNHWCNTLFIPIRMLPKIGFGILLVLLSRVSFMVLDVYVEKNTTNYCALESNNVNTTGPYENNSFIFMLPLVVGGFGALISIPTMLEFIFAQCPCNLRALMIGLFNSGNQIAASVGWGTLQLFKYLHEVAPGCEFYKYLTDVMVLLVCFISFFCIKRYYKPRIINTVFSPYSAAEQYYSKLIKERSSSCSS